MDFKRRLAAAYFSLVLLLLFADSLGKSGFLNQVLTLESSGLDLRQARLEQEGFNIKASSVAMPEPGGASLLLQSRTLRRITLELPASAFKGPSARLRASYKGRSLDLEVRRGALKRDLTPLLADYRLRLPVLGEFHYDPGPRPAARALRALLALALLFAAAAFLAGRMDGPARAAAPAPPALAAGAAALGAGLVFAALQSVAPAYFFRGDNYTQFLPRTLYALEEFFAGRMPFLDPLQGFGTPILATGTYPVLDPLAWAAYGLAKGMLGRPGLLFDAYALLCLTLGSAFFAASAARLGAGLGLAVFTALAFAFNGFVLVMGPTWFYVQGIVLYLPLLLWFALEFDRAGATWKWWLGSGMARAAFYYCGNVQFLAYGCALELAGYAWMARRRRPEAALAWLGSLLLSVALMAPQFLAQLALTRETTRWREGWLSSAGLNFEGLLATVLPYPLLNPAFPTASEAAEPLLTAVYFIGPLGVLLAGAGLLRWLRGRELPAPALLALGTFALLLALGRSSLVYIATHFIPLVRDFRYIFKLLPFVAFLAALYAVLAAPRLPRRLLDGLLLLSLLAHAYMIAAVLPQSGAFRLPPQAAYPPPPPAELLRHVSPEDQLLTLLPLKIVQPWAELMPSCYATLQGRRGAGLFDPLIPTAFQYPDGRDLAAYFRRWGISKVVVHDELMKPSGGHDLLSQWDEGLRRTARQMPAYQRLASGPGWSLYATGVKPWTLRGPAGSSIQGPAWKARAGLASPGLLEWNLEFRRGYRAFSNGSRLALARSADGWLSAELPAGDWELRLDYTPPLWKAGWAAAAALLLLSLILRRLSSAGRATDL